LINQNRIAFNISVAFYRYLKEKTCEVFSYGVDVHLTDDEIVDPETRSEEESSLQR